MRAGALALVFGTRPELVKLAPMLWELGGDARTIHTGQHPWESLAEVQADLELAEPDTCCTISSMPRGRQIGEAVIAVTEALIAHTPEIVVVQGDTNSTLAGALAATSLGLPLVHVEAGLRAFDRGLPEERNRVVVDHLADLLAAPTDTARNHLRDEGIAEDRIVVTGNTVVDAAKHCLPSAEARARLRKRFGLTANGYAVATFHRPENVDHHEPLRTIVDELSRLPIPVLLPVHPRTVDRARHAGVELARGSVRIVPPLGYRDFLAVAADSALLITDSGGVQEEASVLGRPAVVVRRSTERPEILGTVTTLVTPGPAIGHAVGRLLMDLDAVHRRLAELASPFGDGHAARHTIAAIERWLGSR